MLKSYSEMRKIDVRPYCETRKEGKEELLYLNWAKCIDLLYANGAEKVHFGPVRQPNGSSLINSDVEFTDKNGVKNRAYETRIHITIDDLEFEFQGPVMNGANPVKDNSMSQQRLWNCQCRLFVKAIAIYTGLGFDLWLKNEENEAELQKAADVHHDIMKVRDRVFETVTSIMKRSGMTKTQLADRLGISQEALETNLLQYVQLARFEDSLNACLRELQ